MFPLPSRSSPCGPGLGPTRTQRASLTGHRLEWGGCLCSTATAAVTARGQHRPDTARKRRQLLFPLPLCLAPRLHAPPPRASRTEIVTRSDAIPPRRRPRVAHIRKFKVVDAARVSTPQGTHSRDEEELKRIAPCRGTLPTTAFEGNEFHAGKQTPWILQEKHGVWASHELFFVLEARSRSVVLLFAIARGHSLILGGDGACVT